MDRDASASTGGAAGRERASGGRVPRVLIIIENLPLVWDRRVQRECRALLDRGFAVSVICPRAPAGSPPPRLGVTVYDYPSPSPGSGALGYIWEYIYSGLAAAVLIGKALMRGVDVLQVCNPPDIYFPLALPLKMLGRPFVFDHHDLAPELYAERFGREGLVYRILLLLERATFLTADHVISTNESFRRLALTRGRKQPSDVTVVRNGPSLEEVGPRQPRPELKEGRTFLCCWAGVMGSVDDGVDLALEAIDHLVHRIGRSDCHFAFIGDGEMSDEAQALAEKLGLSQFVTFTGWLASDDVYTYLATADVALQPDPKNRRTDVSTATKTMEYMAFGLPTVAFDVNETRFSAGDAALYAEPNEPASLAAMLNRLLNDPGLRRRMGAIGRRRVEQELAWDHQREAYVAAFDSLLRSRSARRWRRRPFMPSHDA